jgi:hypothetical protein
MFGRVARGFQAKLDMNIMYEIAAAAVAANKSQREGLRARANRDMVKKVSIVFTQNT